MGVEPFETVEAGQRTAKRARVLLSAKLYTPASVYEARLRDLSRHGALIESPALVKPGIPVTFERGKTSIAATVAWVSGIRIGLQFDHPVDESELLIDVGRAQAAASGPSSHAPSGMMRGMSAQDRRLAQAWSVAVGLNLPEKED